jgi:hypothetical protein
MVYGEVNPLIICFVRRINEKGKFYSILKYRMYTQTDRLCGLVVRVPGCLHRGPGFDPRCYQIFCVAVGLERGTLSLVRINEELLEREVAAPV